MGSLVGGIIAIDRGAASIGNNPTNLWLIFIGAFLLVEGGLLIAAPISPKWLILDGIALLTVGIWNIAITLAGMHPGNEGGAQIFGYLGFAQVIWGFQSFAQCIRFWDMPTKKPSPDFEQELAAVQREVSGADIDLDRKIIVELTGHQFASWSALRIKGRLEEDHGIFLVGSSSITGGGRDVIFARKDDIVLGETSLRLGNRRFVNCQMSDRMRGRLENWLGGASGQLLAEVNKNRLMMLRRTRSLFAALSIPATLCLMAAVSLIAQHFPGRLANSTVVAGAFLILIGCAVVWSAVETTLLWCAVGTRSSDAAIFLGVLLGSFVTYGLLPLIAIFVLRHKALKKQRNFKNAELEVDVHNFP